MHIAEGKGKRTVKNHLGQKGVNVKKISHASMDMAPSYITGVQDYFPNNAAMDKVRKLKKKEHDELKGYNQCNDL